MDVNYFLKKFRSYPEAIWTTGVTYNGWTYQCCALGLCDNSEKQPLNQIFYGAALNTVGVNDGWCELFKQATPKARILAALEYIKNL